MKRRLGMVIDQERCIGCEACTVACKVENQGTEHWIRVETENRPQKDTPEGCFPNLKMTFLPKLCNHCDAPPCVDSCPLEALVKRDDGLVMLEDDKCDGCQVCLEACPYDAIHFSQDKGIVEKCHLCAHRIEQGLDPFCAICCEGQAIFFGDFNDKNSKVSRLVATREVYQLNLGAGTAPSIYYCPPKKPRRL